MIEVLVLIVIVGLAISNLTHILVEIDLFEPIRRWPAKIPIIGKVFTCKFCQSNWLALAAGIYIATEVWLTFFPMPIRALILWQAIHWISRRGHKLEDGIPITAVANVNVSERESGS